MKHFIAKRFSISDWIISFLIQDHLNEEGGTELTKRILKRLN